MRKAEFYFDSRDGDSRIHAVRYLPDTGEVTCVVQLVHGMAEYVERYEEFAQFLTDRGIVVTGEDHLGHGKSVKKDGALGYFCEQDPATVIVRDVHRLKKMTQEMYPAVPYIIFGHSMGSFMVRNYIRRYGTGISGAILCGTGTYGSGILNLGRAVVKLEKRWKGSDYVSRLVNSMVFGKNNKAFEPARTGMDWLSKDPEKVEQYMADPLCGFPFPLNGFETLFELIAGSNDRETLTRIPKDLPVFIISGDRDPVGKCGKGVRKAYDTLKAAGLSQVEMKLYEEDRHELLNETDRAVVMQDIYEWIRHNILA